MVYVISKNGQPIMPTNDRKKVRLLLNAGKAKVVRRTPFTIRLLTTTHCYTQGITLGADAGSKTIGLSATTEKEELFAGEVALRTDVVKLLSGRKELRRSRRNRKTRYRKCRNSNRVHSKKDGWLAPSIGQKINTHIQCVKKLYQLLPISHTVVEVAAFDIQKIKNPEIEGAEYQEGEMYGYNVREYVLWRDGHQCQCCHGKSGDKVLNVHHLESRRTGGNAPNNLVALCKTCHELYHKGEAHLDIKRGASFKDAAFMGIMRWAFYDQLKEMFPSASMTFGYITKNTRINCGLEKAHAVDARCISGNPLATPASDFYIMKAVRSHNRQIHKCSIAKGGSRKLNQTPKYVFGYQLFDKVLCAGQEGFVFGRRSSGSFDIRLLDGTRLSAGISFKKLKRLETRKTILTQKEVRATSSPCLKAGVSVA